MSSPDKRREINRRYREANKEKLREYGRRYYQEHKEEINQRHRRWQQANPEKSREYGRRYAQANPDKEKERKIRNREANRDASRRYRARRGTDGRRVQHWALNHGLRPEDWARMWDAQNGLCYLCGDELTPAGTHIDHDHRCCPRDHSCSSCRRGLACGHCNRLIGLADDNPVRLRLIAGNLETALAAFEARRAGRPEQLTLEIS